MKKINEIESTGLTSQDIPQSVRPETSPQSVITDKDKYDIDEDLLMHKKDKSSVISDNNTDLLHSIRAKKKRRKLLSKYERLFKESIELNSIYTVQSYIDPKIVQEKRKNKDYEITIVKIKDDNKYINILVDGHHSYEASKLDHVKPEIKISNNPVKMSLEQYVTSFNDLSNPINIVTKKELW